jgi:protein TonB
VAEQAPQVATLIEQSSGAAQTGGDATKRRAYLGQVRKTLERSKVNPRSVHAGTVLVRFTVGPQGEVLSRSIQQSSGSKILDDAAMAALDRAAPFPPLPQEIANGPLEVQVPFRFITR